jgi:hypothetical protein
MKLTMKRYHVAIEAPAGPRHPRGAQVAKRNQFAISFNGGSGHAAAQDVA